MTKTECFSRIGEYDKMAYMKIIGILLLLFGVYLIWQYFELKKFNITTYDYQTSKVRQSLRFAVVSDLHAHSYGKDNEILLRRIREERPDFILIPGDLIVSKYPETYETAYAFLKELVKIAPVYFSNGNHESRVSRVEVMQTEVFLAYEQKVQALGVHILNNDSEIIEKDGEKIHISGLEIPLECYGKGSYEPLTGEFLEKALGKAKEEHLEILMAHNPMFAPVYAKWGADITVSGHNHGGLVRIPGIGSVFSPQYALFPKYDAGEFTIDGKKIYVSKGLGTHTFHIRIFDRAEVLLIRINP